MSKRIVKELLALVVALAVAGGIMYGYARSVSAKPSFTTLTGQVNEVPVSVSSPVYGELLSMSITPGSTVKQGETLATIRRLDGDRIALPKNTDLFHIEKNGDVTLTSPVDGMVTNIHYGEHSTVATAAPLIDLATPNTTRLIVFLPTSDTPQSYSHFYAAATPNSSRMPIKLIKPLPVQVVTNIPNKTVPYLAIFTDKGTSGEQLVGSSTVTIFAEQKAKGGVLPICPALCHS